MIGFIQPSGYAVIFVVEKKSFFPKKQQKGQYYLFQRNMIYQSR